MPYIIDAHEDVAYNILTFDRDICRSAADTRKLEAGTQAAVLNNGECTLGWPDYQRGQVALVFSTLFLAPRKYSGGKWESQSYGDYPTARRLHHAQLDVYRRLWDEHPDCFQPVQTKADLKKVLTPWQEAPADYPKTGHPTGQLLLMEGAEGLQDFSELEEWWQAGLRIIGPVWSGTRFCGGMHEKGSFTQEGYELLDVMAGLGYILDISHMTEESALQALDRYEGRVIASHANVRALVNGSERHLSYTVIKRLVERNGMMGIIPYNRFLNAEWEKGDPREKVTLARMADHIDAVCQAASSTRHVAIGTDLDGGFGWPNIPLEMDTIADMQKLAPILAERGYSAADIELIFGRNWQRILEETLPA